MKKIVLLLTILVTAVPMLAQKSKSKSASGSAEIKIPMTADRWETAPNSVEFVNYKGQPAMKLSQQAKAVAKDITFSNGTIEYDIEPLNEGFAGIYFRMADDKENEFLYLRVSRGGNPAAMDAIQYAPFIKGVLLWDMFPYYQGPAAVKKNEWNHIKMVVSGKQMIVYVNDQTKTTLEVPRLEGNTTTGKVQFVGVCAIANVVIRPDAVEGLSPNEGFDPTHHDPRYIRAWQVNEPQPLPKGKELYEADFPNVKSKWQDIHAERRGLINVTGAHGQSDGRRFVWLRTKLISATEQKRKISLGFSDEVWVYVNKQPVFVDKNIYTSPAMRKEPDGRISIENSQFEIPLRKGENDVLIGLANDFYGWGIIARLDNMEGIDVSLNFPAPLVPKDINLYTGVYGAPDKTVKLTFTAENDVLMGKATGQTAIALEYFEKDKFRYPPANLIIEFYPEEKKVILKEEMGSSTWTKE